MKNSKDTTAAKNDAAINKVGLEAVVKPRKENPQGAIMHNKFVVLLKKTNGGELVPQAQVGPA